MNLFDELKKRGADEFYLNLYREQIEAIERFAGRKPTQIETKKPRKNPFTDARHCWIYYETPSEGKYKSGISIAFQNDLMISRIENGRRLLEYYNPTLEQIKECFE